VINKIKWRHREGNRLMYGCVTGTTTANGNTERVEWPPGCRAH
jgi:hypothetical protein